MVEGYVYDEKRRWWTRREYTDAGQAEGFAAQDFSYVPSLKLWPRTVEELDLIDNDGRLRRVRREDVRLARSRPALDPVWRSVKARRKRNEETGLPL